MVASEPTHAPISWRNECIHNLYRFIDNVSSHKAICTGVMHMYNDVCLDPQHNITDYKGDISPETKECCHAIKSFYKSTCEGSESFQDQYLAFAACVLFLCITVRTLIRKFEILWLPEVAGVTLVGAMAAFVKRMMFSNNDLWVFDEPVFMRLLLPPILFHAALNVDLQSLRKYAGPIFVLSFPGTLFCTIICGFIVNSLTTIFSDFGTRIPMLESLIFGALISSIDPVATIGALKDCGMSQEDLVYIIILGEALFNDGAAVVLFQTLIKYLDESIDIGISKMIYDSILRFTTVALGSVAVGLFSGILALGYFWALRGLQSVVMEVIGFFLWALFAFWIADGLEWSGIVSIIGVGFFMRMMLESTNTTNNILTACLSNKARAGISTVSLTLSSLTEMMIFAYLGILVFSQNCHWNGMLMLTAMIACTVSRAMEIITIYYCYKYYSRSSTRVRSRNACNNNEFFLDSKTCTMLWMSGLRGAMSLALSENIPVYDFVTGRGTQLKPQLKAMASTGILFTLFIFGGSTRYIMKRIGIESSDSDNIHARETSGAFLEPLLEDTVAHSEESTGSATPT